MYIFIWPLISKLQVHLNNPLAMRTHALKRHNTHNTQRSLYFHFVNAVFVRNADDGLVLMSKEKNQKTPDCAQPLYYVTQGLRKMFIDAQPSSSKASRYIWVGMFNCMFI